MLFGMSDRRFCNETCRNSFNRKWREAELIKANENLPVILKIIKHNYDILKNYYSSELAHDEGTYMDTQKFLDVVINFAQIVSRIPSGKYGTVYLSDVIHWMIHLVVIQDFPELAEL